MKIKIFLLFFLISSFSFIVAQVPTQTIRGIVIDKISQSSLQGAIVQILNTDPTIVATSDANGKFELKNISKGKQSLKISFLGYK